MGKTSHAKKNVANQLLIKESAFFSSLPSVLLEASAGRFLLHTHKKMEFFDPNLLLERFYFILSGKVEFTRQNIETGREVTLSVLDEHDSFDVISLLDNKPRNIDIKPATDLQLISLPLNLMREWVWKYPELNQQLMPYLASKMREQEDLVADLALHDVATRLSRLILKNFNRQKAIDEKGKSLINNLSDESLARMVGSVRQVINKHLQHWKKAGVLKRERDKILINDLEQLKSEAKKAELLIDQ